MTFLWLKLENSVYAFFMSEKPNRSPENDVPRCKKRLVKSKQDSKGHNQNKNSTSSSTGGSTSQPIVNKVSTLPTKSQPHSAHNYPEMSQFPAANPTTMQMAGMQVPSNMMYPYFPPPVQGTGGAGAGGGSPMVMSMGPQPMYKPDWATELISEVKQMSKELGKLSTIEKTLASISTKINSLESKVNLVETQVNSCEKACSFLSNQYEDHRKELSDAKSQISSLKSKCESMESKSKEHQAESAKLQRKVLDLESRSMRDNLVFHGLPESTPEDCESLVKTLLKEELGMGEFETREIIFDRIHRIGRKENQRPGYIRPIVAKFHRYSEREQVRELKYAKRDALRATNKSVKPQIPAEVLEKRKPLYSVFEKAKNDGARVKFVLDKLYINGREYVPPM